jgi:hypothetical protein
LGLGEFEQATHWLDKAAEARTAEIIHIKCEPVYDRIGQEAGFQELVKKIGLAR